MNYYVYQLRLEDSESPFYVGKGTGKRAFQHLKAHSLKKQSHKNNVINKATREGVNVLVEILFDGLTEEQAHAKEVELIAFYGRRINGGCLTNATDGGEGVSGFRHSIETKQRISSSKTGRRNSKSHNEKISASKVGFKMPRYAIEKSATAHVGKKHSEESIKKMSSAKMGKRLNSSTKRSVKFSHWDRNPDWKIAGFLFDLWNENGRPTNAKMSEMLGRDIKNIHRRFREGWVPASDPDWNQYSVT